MEKDLQNMSGIDPFDRRDNQQMDMQEIIDYYLAHEVAHNGLMVTIDFLEFTLFVDRSDDADITGREIEAIEDVLQIDSGQFFLLPSGMNGYPKRLKWTPTTLFVLYGAGPRQGVHVTMSGNACRAYVSQIGSLLMLLQRIVELKGKVTRLDLAVDDLTTQYYSVQDLIGCYEKHEIISRWKYMESQIKSHMESKTNVKECVYFGSMKSDCFLRVYNKSIEQAVREQKNIEAIASIETYWTRWELVLKRDAAMSVVNMLHEHMLLGEIWCGIMANYFRLVESTKDTNRSRWETQKKWVQFVGAAAPLTIKMYPERKDITTLMTWVDSQITPSLAAIVKANKDGLLWLVERTLAADSRINPYYRSILSAIQEPEKPEE